MGKELFIQAIVPLREKLLRYAMGFLKDKNEAEDLVQETMMRLWGMREKLGEYTNKSALSYTITKNLCINRLKSKQYAEQGLDNVQAQSIGTLPDDRLAEKDNAAHIINIIEQLPNLQQAIFRMRHIDGLEVAEIAELTGSNAESIRMNLSRGRKRVLELFVKIEDYGTQK